MKKLFFMAVLAIMAICSGCNKAGQQEVKPTTEPTTVSSSDAPGNPDPGDNPAISMRACGANECECSITTDIDASLIICGDVPLSTATCSFCGGTDNGTGFTADFNMNVARLICVTQSGGFCVTNNTGNSVTVTVQFGTSTPSSIAIGAGLKFCWSTNTDCTATIESCP